MVTAICNSICFQFLNAVPIISGGNLNSNCVSHPPPWKNLSFRSRNCRNICFRSGIRVFSGKKFSVVCEVPVVNQSEFSEEVLRSDLPVLVEFVADWCGPCRLMSPAMDWASQEYKKSLKVVKIDHDSNPRLIEEYKVFGLPALIIFKSGKEVPNSRREGAMTKIKLKEYLDTLLESIAVT